MKKSLTAIVVFVMLAFSLASQAQNAIPASGGNATGSGGSVSYTIGQITYTTNSGSNGTVSHGVQQPFEISVITAIKKTEGISLECLVYPNPTRGYVKLIIATKDFNDLRFQLFDMNGILLQNKRIEGVDTEILIGSLSTSTYILKVLSGNMEIKTFKIIKN